METQADKKSQALAISFSLLLLQSISIISLNYWNSSESDHDAIAINLAGRQRMLSQKVEKDLLKLNYTAQSDSDASILLQDLSVSAFLFNQTLTKLSDGKLPDSNGSVATVESIKSQRVTDLIKQANALWLPMNNALLPVISSPDKLSGETVKNALIIVMRGNRQLLQTMDSITSEIEDATHKKSSQLRMMEAAAISILLVNFGFVLFYFRRQLTLLAESKLLSTRIMENAGTAIIVITADGDIELSNRSAEQLFGFNTGELIGLNIRTLINKPYFMQIGKRADGDKFSFNIDLTEIQTLGRRLFIASMHDLTEQKLLEEKLSHLANHDPLTGLPNRLLFMDRLAQTIARAHRKNELAAVLFIDLDRFKQVNDSLGHATGDLLLKKVAERLTDCLREGDTLTRLGGDEFIMIIDASDVNASAIVAQKILSELGRVFHLNGHHIQISGSIGTSLYPVDSSDANTLLHYADIAMYHAKSAGRNTCCKYAEIAEILTTKPSAASRFNNPDEHLTCRSV